WTPVALGVLYVFAAAMQSRETVGTTGGAAAVVLTLPAAAGTGSTALSIVMELGITASWFACIIGSTTAASRTLFAMGREGVVSERIGNAPPRFGTPHMALIVATPIIAAVPIASLFITGSSREVMIGLLA